MSKRVRTAMPPEERRAVEMLRTWVGRVRGGIVGGVVAVSFGA